MLISQSVIGPGQESPGEFHSALRVGLEDHVRAIVDALLRPYLAIIRVSCRAVYVLFLRHTIEVVAGSHGG